MSTSLFTSEPAEAPRRRRAEPVQITDRDRELLRFIAAHSFVTVNHAQQFLGVSDTATYRRLQKLAGAGLLRQERIFHAQPGIYRITNGGLAVIDSPLNKPSVDLRTYRHELNVPVLWLAAQRGVFGDRVTAVWTEREIKHHQRVGGYADRPCVGVPMLGRPQRA